MTASIKARLLAEARRRGEEFEFYLVRFACERFLYRLGASGLRNRAVVKGAVLLNLWLGDPYRSTRDLDLSAFGASDAAGARTFMETVCRVPCVEDGLTFDIEQLAISPIGAQQKYPGQRAVLNAYLGTARIRMQVDFSVGDAGILEPEDSDYPTLLAGLPIPRVRAYPREAVIAEKFEAMVHLGRRNSRMKDFHDVWALSLAFDFDAATLRDAIAKCFAARGTAWTNEVPDALKESFYLDRDLTMRWRAYLSAGAFRRSPPHVFDEVGKVIRSFLCQLRGSFVSGHCSLKHWPAGGPWQMES